MHVRLGNVLDDHRNVVVPSSERLIVGGGDEAAIIVYKGNGVDRAEMLIVGLDDLMGSSVVLKALADIAKPSLTWIIFLSCIPAMKIFCFEGSG